VKAAERPIELPPIAIPAPEVITAPLAEIKLPVVKPELKFRFTPVALPVIVSVVPTVKLVLVCKLPAVELIMPTPTPPATNVLPPTLNAPLIVDEPVMVRLVPVALVNNVLPNRVDEPRLFANSELKMPPIVVEPVTARLVVVALVVDALVANSEAKLL
jgi:hypothetical protein